MRIRIVQGGDGEKGLEEALNEIAAMGTIDLLVWKESSGYWVIRYTEGL